jgi:hypothetical protein
LIIAGALVFAILAAIIYGFKLNSKLDGLKSVAMIMSSLYNLFILACLLSYGLCNLPLYLWQACDHRTRLGDLLERAESVRGEYRAALVEFYLIVSQCKNMIATKKTGENAVYMEMLEEEIPKKDLEGQSLGGVSTTNFQLDNLRKDQVVDEDFIAEVRNIFKITYFLYKRKKSRWLELYKEI